MIKRLFAAMATVIGALVLAGSASAQVYQGNTSFNGTGLSGSYHIVLNQSNSTTFQITSISGNTGSQTPSAPIDKIKVQFYNTTNPVNAIGVTSVGVGGTNNPTFNNFTSVVGGPGGATFPKTYAQFTSTGLGANLSANSSAPNGVFRQIGGNVITLSGTPTPVRSVLFTLTDANNHSFTFFDYVNTPETGSMLLLMAALLPLAFVLRRRRAPQMPV